LLGGINRGKREKEVENVIKEIGRRAVGARKERRPVCGSELGAKGEGGRRE